VGAGGPVGAGEGSGGRNHRRHRGPQGVLQGEGREPPRELLDLLPRPREVREGQAPHGRHSGPLYGQDVHGGGLPLRREEDVGLGDGHRVQDQDRDGQGDVGRAQGALPRVQGRLRLPYCPRSS